MTCHGNAALSKAKHLRHLGLKIQGLRRPPEGAKSEDMTAEPLIARKGAPLKGEARVPGDKSISHRALIFGAMAVGETQISGLLEGEDVLATAAVLRALGADVERLGEGTWRVRGRGVSGFREPAGALDFGNSGTGARLLMGMLAQQPLRATLIGDSSLQSRPMGRVMGPLSDMGVEFAAAEGGRLPLTLTSPDRPRPITYELPTPSAQVKSAILLAGLAAPGTTQVIEPLATRDHTERMARAFGADISVEETSNGRVISVTGHAELLPTEVVVPSDPSSAAFPVVAGLIVPGSDVLVPGVLINETRAGLFTTLKEMGADITFENTRDVAGEEIADIRAKASTLEGVSVPASRAPSMIDEYPVLSIAAAYANGETVMNGVGELRVKESDRLAAVAAGLRAVGADVDEADETLTVRGKGGLKGGGKVATHLDHRIAMSFLVGGMAAETPVTVDDGAMIATSLPTFVDLMNGLGAKVERANR